MAEPFSLVAEPGREQGTDVVWAYEGPFGPMRVRRTSSETTVDGAVPVSVPWGWSTVQTMYDEKRDRGTVLREGLLVGGARVHQPRRGILRNARRLYVDRPGRGATSFRLRGFESLSLESDGLGRLVHGSLVTGDRGVVAPAADALDVALFLAVSRSGLAEYAVR